MKVLLRGGIFDPTQKNGGSRGSVLAAMITDIYPAGGVPDVWGRLSHRTIPAIKHQVTFLELRSAKRKNN
ncbi:hypothetical protein CBW53_21895 [Yersinia frederiksenii]|nr:hypothetical protein CBW53_21895 [Yersinia frederiksenii]CNJ34317.1 Uncharacterised protein [Yersinia frederiksenii]